MHKPEISLFHHPTTTVFVDDSDDFLYSIALGVDHLPYRSFSSPAQGLAYVNQFSRAYDVPAEERLPSSSLSVGKLFARVGSKLNDHNRFAEPSVLVVDYSMPGMNGLDLCAQVTNPNIKKVLLTGVADERVAIDALNVELIDFYISKRESTLAQRLRGIISHLETRYFQDLYGWSRDSEVRNVLPHLFDPAFADFFEDTLESLGIVEHYPLVDATGFRLINGYGASKRLLVATERDLADFLQRVDMGHLSEAARARLLRHELIPIQGLRDTSVPLKDNHLLVPTVVEGESTWYCLLAGDGHLNEAPCPTTSFQQFLKTPLAYSEQADFVSRQ